MNISRTREILNSTIHQIEAYKTKKIIIKFIIFPVSPPAVGGWRGCFVKFSYASSVKGALVQTA